MAHGLRSYPPMPTVRRCGWVAKGDDLMVAHHDEEWGTPSHDDRHLFEMLTLEGAQAGLSWSTILRKREGYRRAFADFDPGKVARFGSKDVERLLADPGIVRNRLKVESTVNNAARVLDVQAELGEGAGDPGIVGLDETDTAPRHRRSYARVVSETMSARFTSWMAARNVRTRSPSSSISAHERHRS